MAKREPITLTDNPLAPSSSAPAPLNGQPAKKAAGATNADGDGESPATTPGGSTARHARRSNPPRSVKRIGTSTTSAGDVTDPVLGPTRLGPSLDEALTTVFARVPESIALAFERMTLAIRQTERQPSQKALPAQELLSALLWRYGNGDDPDGVRELIELLREYRAARYAASIKGIETKPAA